VDVGNQSPLSSGEIELLRMQLREILRPKIKRIGDGEKEKFEVPKEHPVFDGDPEKLEM
jgi:hypothetical protein